MTVGRTFRVKAVADGLIPSVELVLARPLAWLADQGALEYSLDYISDINPKEDLAAYDLLIVMRACMPNALELVESAKSQGLPVIYAIDDDFETLDPNTPLGRHYHENNAWQRLLAICAKCDQVWAFSKPLKAKIAPVQPRTVMPPALSGIESIERLIETSNHVKQAHELRIGYGASKYHAADIESIRESLLDLLDEFPNLQIDFIDVNPEGFDGHERVNHFPKFGKLEEYYAFAVSRDWTAGIAPLKRNPANDAKTDNKYREYAALGVPAVYSEAPPYRRSVIHDFNGVVATNRQEWVDGIRRILTDSRYRKKLAENARRDVRNRYGIVSVATHYFHLMQSVAKAPIQVVVYAADLPTTDIDIRQPFLRLKAEGKLDWEFVSYKEQPEPEQIARADVLVISRVHEPFVREMIARIKDEFGIPVIFSWDDDFFSIPKNLGALARHHLAPENIESLERILTEVDLVKVSSPTLLARTRQYTDRTLLAPYGFDFEQLDGLPAPIRSGNEGIVIGFFGGKSHGPSLDLVFNALRKVASLAPNVRFEFFGPRTPLLETLPRVSFIDPVASSRDAIAKLHELAWDIGLAPLEINDFNRAKLPTKYRDYGACHVAGVYTRIDPYTSVVTDGVTGMIADNEESAWVEAIMKLVENPELRRSLAANAHAHVRNELSLDQSVEAWREILDRFAPAEVDEAAQLERERKRANALQERVSFLTGQVEVLRTSARALLDAHRNPYPPAASLGGKLRRYFYDRLRHLPGRESFAAIPSPRPTDAAHSLVRGRLAVGRESSVEIALGPDLASMPYVEYPFVPTQSAGGDTVRLPTSSQVPLLGGYVGVEIVSPQQQIHCHELVPIDRMEAGEVAVFRIPPVENPGPGWRIRCFVRNARSPVHVHVLPPADGQGEPELVVSLEWEGGKVFALPSSGTREESNQKRAPADVPEQAAKAGRMHQVGVSG